MLADIPQGPMGIVQDDRGFAGQCILACLDGFQSTQHSGFSSSIHTGSVGRQVGDFEGPQECFWEHIFTVPNCKHEVLEEMGFGTVKRGCCMSPMLLLFSVTYMYKKCMGVYTRMSTNK